jgi:hypothetical protein
VGAGFAVAPRIGANIMIGRSGIFTPDFFVQFSTASATMTPNGTEIGSSASYGFGLGYTVMW